MKSVDVKKLLELGAHFGHKISRTHPKSRKYIHSVQNKIAIIDLFKTKESFDKASDYLYKAGKNNKRLLVVASKRVIQNFAHKYCKQNNIFYITEKWIGGFFTNFSEISKNIKRINEWKKERDSGKWDTMLKHERVKLEKKLNKLERIYEGVLKMDKIPNSIFIIDTKKEKNALMESEKIRDQQALTGKKQLDIVAILDTNSNPEQVQYPVVVNDDTSGVLEYLFELLLAQYIAGKKQASKQEELKTSKKNKEIKNSKNSKTKKTENKKATKLNSNKKKK